MSMRVSVVIPTYNCAARLVQALESVAAQTYARERIEIVVIDDGSGDDTAERVARFAAGAAPETRYVRQSNAGPAAARNHGLRLARGDAIAFLDADDRWQPDKLAAQLPLLGGEVGLVYCGNSFVDADGQPLAGYVRTIPALRGDILLPLFCEFFLLTSAVVLPKPAIDAVGAFQRRLRRGAAAAALRASGQSEPARLRARRAHRSGHADAFPARTCGLCRAPSRRRGAPHRALPL